MVLNEKESQTGHSYKQIAA